MSRGWAATAEMLQAWAKAAEEEPADEENKKATWTMTDKGRRVFNFSPSVIPGIGRRKAAAVFGSLRDHHAELLELVNRPKHEFTDNPYLMT